MTATLTRLVRWSMLAGALLPWTFQGCGDPIDSGGRITIIGPPSVTETGPSTDSISAYVQGVQIIFAARPHRPHYNHEVAGAHYISAEVKRESFNGDYDQIRLRIDCVRDTGTFLINAPYSAPKTGVDTTAPAKIGAAFRRRIGGEADEEFTTDAARPRGEVHVDHLDRERKLIRGTFWFVAFNIYGDSVRVDRGTFRLSIK